MVPEVHEVGIGSLNGAENTDSNEALPQAKDTEELTEIHTFLHFWLQEGTSVHHTHRICLTGRIGRTKTVTILNSASRGSE